MMDYFNLWSFWSSRWRTSYIKEQHYAKLIFANELLLYFGTHWLLQCVPLVTSPMANVACGIAKHTEVQCFKGML